jgi:hypothetical protein
MAWGRRTTIRRPQAWAATGAYRELARRLPRCAGSRRLGAGLPGATLVNDMIRDEPPRSSRGTWGLVGPHDPETWSSIAGPVAS